MVAPVPPPVSDPVPDPARSRVSESSSIVGGGVTHGGEDLEDVKAMVQGLKDCIVGCVNWVYETELFFGGKGEEVRAFGWVFLAPRVDGDG